ncbi:MAG: T9SS type A sorting domain-containing protein [bacterium]
MKNIYSLLSFILLFISVGVMAQSLVYAPALRAPENEDDEQNPNVVLDWDAVTGQNEVTYEAQIATQDDFSDAVTYPRTDLTAQPTEDLLFGEHYFWRVRAYDNGEVSEWSETWTFQVINTVEIKEPGNGDEVYADPVFEWEEITGLLKYELEIDSVYTWMPEQTGAEDDINGSFIVSDDNIWLVGVGGLILHYDGTTWTIIDAGVSDDLFDIYFTDASNGYAVGEGGLVMYYDGANWSESDAGVSADLNAVTFLDADNGYAVGEDGTIVKYSGGAWTEETSPGSDDLFAIFALAADDIKAAGSDGVIYHYDGMEWLEESTGADDIFDIWYNDDSNGWICGNGGFIYYYDGNSWTEQPTGVTRDLLGISMMGTGGYAVGENGTMVMYSSGSWTEITSSLADDIHTISLTGDMGVIAGEDGGVSLKRGDVQQSPFYKVHAISGDSLEYHSKNQPFGAYIFFRMRAIHSVDTSDWSLTNTIYTYSSPELDMPKDETADLSLKTLFRWKRYEGASEYYFDIDDNPDFTSPSEFLLDSLSINYTMLKFGHEFYWRVKAAHAKDISDWSEVWWCKTLDHVELVSPEDGGKDIPACPAYTWEAIEGSKEYEIEVADNPDFDEAMMATSESTTYQCQSPMERNTLYYWRVRAVTAQDTSSWSNTWSFTTEGYIGIEEIQEGSVKIYPNPNHGQFTVNFAGSVHGEYVIKVADLTGRVILSEIQISKPGENQVKINLGDCDRGIYLISIYQGESVLTRKLFID